MRNKMTLIGVGIAIGLLLAIASSALAGSLNPPAPPGNSTSQMYTLEQICNRLDTGAAATKMTSFEEPSAGPSTGTMHTLDEIYNLTGSRALVPKTGMVTGPIGSDGNLKRGVPWPNPRFTDNDNGTVTDNLTKLIWLKNANCFGQQAWSDALSSANTLNDGECGLSDGSAEGAWRLSNMRELQSLLTYGYYSPAVPNTAGTGQWAEGSPFAGVQSAEYCLRPLSIF